MREISEMLSAWNSFYVMIGSSAAALTGLMFVVITLISDDQRSASEDGVSTFSTPTVVHFSCTLFTSALMSVRRARRATNIEAANVSARC